jgi:hypothetical protein
MELRCPDCNHNLKAPYRLEGKKGKCPNCGKIIDIPFLLEEVEAPKDINIKPVVKNNASMARDNLTTKGFDQSKNSVDMKIQMFAAIVAPSFVACIIVCIILAKIYPGFGFGFSFIAASIIFVVVAKNSGVKDIGCMYFILIVGIFWFAVIIFVIIQSF